MPKKQNRQNIIGSYNAQAYGPGAQANVEVTQQFVLKSTAATAPAAPHHFTGRRSDLDVLMRLFTSTEESTKFIALQGMGGIGKTATALKLATELREHFTGGIFWGSLPDHNGDSTAILRTWARICGEDVSEEQNVNVIVQIVRGLLTNRRSSKGPLIAIIDDVQDEWLPATRLLRQAIPSNISCLITTRDEILANTLGATVHHLDALAADDALALLEEYAGKTLVEDEPSATSNLLRTIGYLPLAIELVGNRLASMSRKPGFKLEQLQREVAERASTILSLPGHPGLAATFAITYDDLPVDAQHLFSWLGVFTSAPLDINNVAGVLDLGIQETEVTLDRLVQVALLNWGNIEKTYTMHPLLRQYARTLLVDAGELTQAEMRHLSFHLEIALKNYHPDPVARYGVRFQNPSESCLSAQELKIIFTTLTGFSSKFQGTISALEQIGTIDLARACYVVNQGIWTKEQVEMIVLGSQNPMSVFGGLTQPHQRHLYVHDLLHARAAVLGGKLDEILSNSRIISNQIKSPNLTNNDFELEIDFDGKLYLKHYRCMAPIAIPWLYNYPAPLTTSPGIPFHIFIRAREIADMQLQLESDLRLAGQLLDKSGQLIFVALPFDFTLLPNTFKDSIYRIAQKSSVILITCPELIINLESDASRRLSRSRTLRK